MGVHLCGLLSPCAIELFAASEMLRALLLVPCCLDKRTDGLLKMRAKQLGIDPYEAKVRELSELLEAKGAAVTTKRASSMRTAYGGEETEGSAGVKNAVILGVKPVSPVASEEAQS